MKNPRIEITILILYNYDNLSSRREESNILEIVEFTKHLTIFYRSSQ